MTIKDQLRLLLLLNPRIRSFAKGVLEVIGVVIAIWLLVVWSVM